MAMRGLWVVTLLGLQKTLYKFNLIALYGIYRHFLINDEEECCFHEITFSLSSANLHNLPILHLWC